MVWPYRIDPESNCFVGFVLKTGVVLLVTIVLNSVAVSYSSISAIPLSVCLKVLAIWVFVSVPLCVVGTISGRHLSVRYEPPCRVNSIPRPIPVSVSWFHNPVYLVPLTGVLPFFFYFGYM